MTKTSETVVFFGSGPVAAASLKYLVEHLAIEAVITKAVPLHHKEAAPVEVLAKDRNLPIFFANTRAELDSVIQKQRFHSRAGLIVDYGVIVSKQTIAAFKLGIINSHFSLLPKWRGADPITFAILNGEKETGVSLMLIVEALDEGPLLAQEKLPLPPDITTPKLTEELITLSNRMLIKYVPRYFSGRLKPLAQPNEPVSYSRKLTKDDGVIDWNQPADKIEREIRAFIDWPKSRTELAGKEVIITNARVVPLQGIPGEPYVYKGKLVVFTGKDALEIDRLKPAGKTEMTAKAFLAGYGKKLKA